MSDGYIHQTPQVTLTYQSGYEPASGVTTIDIPAAYIDNIHTHSGGALVFINGDYMFGQYRKAYVTETPAAIAALTQLHVLLTPQDTAKPAFYMSSGRLTAGSVTTHSGGAKIIYLRGNEKSGLLVTETPAAINAAINAAVEAGGRSYGTLTALGTNQATAAPIITDSTTIDSAAVGTGAVLPAGVIGDTKTFRNNAANAVQLYADGAELILGVAGPTGIPVGPGGALTIQYTANGWQPTNSLATDFMVDKLYDTSRTIEHIELTGTKVGLNVPLTVEARPVLGQIDFVYDFAVDGGAVSSIALNDADGNPAVLPDNSYIVWGMYEPVAALTSSTSAAEIAFGISGDDPSGLLAAAVITGSGTTGVKDFIPDMRATNYTTKSTGDRALIMSISVEALTAGRILGTCYYVTTE